MVFKPFKPLSIKKPSQSTAPTQEPSAKPSESDDGPPAKRPRLISQDTNGTGNACPTTSQRKPLLQVKNVGEASAVSSNESGDGNASTDSPSGVRYFNVLWRKPTAKKNKTWDGDGIISARDGYVYLQDVSGRDMGRAMNGSALKPGAILSIGGKEVEVDTEIPRKEYLAGRPFLETKTEIPTPPSPPRPLPSKKASVSVPTSRERNTSASEPSVSTPGLGRTKVKESRPLSLASRGLISGAYKKPLLESTVMPAVLLDEPTPRHDPKHPGAVVMKRPSSVPKGKRIVDVVVDPILGKHLRPHQREGVKFLYECVMGMRSFNGEGAILADDMGLGKTLQTITLLWTLLKQNPIYEAGPVIKKALIVCPVTLINNWRREVRKWLGNERIGVFVFDDKRKRLTDFTKGKAYSIMIVGYEKLRTVQEGLARGNGVDIVIADEGHRLKTLQNKSGQAIQSLNTTKRVILSGTPIQNDLKEFFAAVDLVNPGVLGTFKSFIKEFEGPIVRSRQPEATEKDIEKGEARNEELRELTSQFMLRRTADILAKYLPPKTEYVLFCKPTNTQAKIYQNVLASPVFQGVIGSSESALQLITILKKLCNSPSLLSQKDADGKPSETITALLSSLPPNLLRHFSPSCSAKIRVLDQLLHHLRTSTSEKIVLVSNYTSTLNLLANLLSSLSLPFLRLDGSTPAQKRQSLVEDFNRLPATTCFAFLLSAKAGGTGLNLIGASRLVLFDVDWNPATDIQAMARIHRDGQKRHCHIYRILLQGSLEEKIWQRQVTKIGLADSVMENKDSVAQFSRDELKDLFRLDVESKCQTHDLLACGCGGRGYITAPDSDDTPLEEDSVELNENDGNESDASLPDLPTLLKASEVDMEEQERHLETKGRRPRASKAKNKNNNSGKQKIQESLSHYAHIDPSLFAPSALTSAVQDTETEPGLPEGLDQVLEDEVLRSLLTDEENRVQFLFKKSTKPEVKDPTPAADEDTKSKPKAKSKDRAKVGNDAGIGTAESPLDLSD
ncbi:DEAD/DEAH box helicase [Aspergillus mulundensis]|uniref:DNA-dependent ATPase n=1 Tax=Aspergillus mulundensis TaxID=1810919 RepID=A0A3D8SV11_9EURO|nr:DNA-dependent ATPase [Aspergillus mulundensis]RDW90126.1 DNA-dependent ATPase [Aspergillus mulundensis]